VETMGMEDLIFRVIVPEEEEKGIKDGKTKRRKKKLLPGYGLAEMVMTDDSWCDVRNTPGVTGLVGSSGQETNPTSLSPHEVDAVLKRLGEEEPSVKVNFELKEDVRVTDGPFADFAGTIEHIDAEKEILKVHVNMFGRETPVELDFTHIDKLSKAIVANKKTMC